MVLLSRGDGLCLSVAICRRCSATACALRLALLPMARALVVALLIFTPQRVLATDRVWKNTATAFNSSGSWTPSGIPGSSDVADFNSAMITQPNLSGSLTIQELFFSTTTASGYDLTSSNTSVKLTLTNTGTGTTSAIDAENTSGTNTIHAPIVLGAAANSTQTFTQAAGGTLIMIGVISSTNTVKLSLAGSGIIQLAGANTYSGGTILASGTTLRINNATALGTGTFTINGGTIDNTTGASITLSNNNAQAWNGDFTFTGTQSLNLGTGAVTLNATRTVTVSANTLTVGGVISGSGFGLTKAGTGTLTLTGANTYTGATTINAGTLLVNGSLASGSATTVNNSGSVLGGTGTINGSVSIASSGAILEAGTGSTGQTLTMKGAVTMGAGSIIQLALGASGAHSTLAIGVGGSISFQSLQKFNIIDLGVTSGSTYNGLVTGIGSDPGTESGWTIANQSWAYNFSYDSANGGEIDLTITAVPEPSTWIAAGLALVAVAYNQRKRIGRRSFGVASVFSGTP